MIRSKICSQPKVPQLLLLQTYPARLRSFKKILLHFFTFGNFVVFMSFNSSKLTCSSCTPLCLIMPGFVLLGFFPHLKTRFQPARSIGSVTNCLHVLVVSDCLSQPFLQLLICIVNHRSWRDGY